MYDALESVNIAIILGIQLFLQFLQLVQVMDQYGRRLDKHDRVSRQCLSRELRYTLAQSLEGWLRMYDQLRLINLSEADIL